MCWGINQSYGVRVMESELETIMVVLEAESVKKMSQPTQTTS